jgi:hypothetical protein
MLVSVVIDDGGPLQSAAIVDKAKIHLHEPVDVVVPDVQKTERRKEVVSDHKAQKHVGTKIDRIVVSRSQGGTEGVDVEVQKRLRTIVVSEMHRLSEKIYMSLFGYETQHDEVGVQPVDHVVSVFRREGLNVIENLVLSLPNLERIRHHALEGVSFFCEVFS